MHLVCNMFISACNIAYPFDVFLVFDNDTCAHENIQSIIDTATDILLVQTCVTTLLINARVCCVIEKKKEDDDETKKEDIHVHIPHCHHY